MTLEELAQAIEDRTGQPVDLAWLAQVVAEILAIIRLLAPCRVDTWLTIEDLPPDIIAVVVASISRILVNPRGLRQETIGEYSYTINSTGNGDLFTDTEKRIIASVAGCGGSFKSITMKVVPPPIDLATPDRDAWAEDRLDLRWEV